MPVVPEPHQYNVAMENVWLMSTIAQHLSLVQRAKLYVQMVVAVSKNNAEVTSMSVMTLIHFDATMGPVEQM